MSTTPPPPPGPPGSAGPPEGFPAPPPASQGPWASDYVAPHPSAAANQMAQPPSIRLAVRLMWAGAVLAVIQAVIPLFQTDVLRDRIHDRDTSMTASELDGAVAFVVTFAIVIGVIGVALWLWMAYANGQGKSWARVVASVLGGLGLLGSAIQLASGQLTPIGVVGTLVYVVLAAAILVLLYRGDSSAYYRANSV